jgi:hypothetical protein
MAILPDDRLRAVPALGLRMLVLLGLVMTTPAFASADHAGREAGAISADCARHIQRPTLMAPELICLGPAPRAAGHEKSIA